VVPKAYVIVIAERDVDPGHEEDLRNDVAHVLQQTDTEFMITRPRMRALTYAAMNQAYDAWYHGKRKG